MKSLDDFKKGLVTTEGHKALADYYLRNEVDPYTGKITLRKTREGYMDFGHNNYPKRIAIPPKVGEDESTLKKESLEEAKKVSKKSVIDPPLLLVLKRQAIRYYPNNTKIALYYSDKLKQHFSVPYSDSGYGSPIQAEEEDSVLNRLTPEMSELYEHLNESNKQRMLNRIFESEDEFNRIAEFAKKWSEKC